jgi:hypothetical protein
MIRIPLAVCFPLVFALLASLAAGTEGRQKKADKRPPKQAKEIYVIMKARLFEVDEAFYKKLSKARWLSRADLDELERQFLNPAQGKLPAADSLFSHLEKQHPLLTWKETNLDPGQEGVLLALDRVRTLLPGPDQVRRGQKGPQTIHEGVSLRALVHISADRRYVRARFTEKSVELEGTEKVNVVVDQDGRERVGETAFLKEATLSLVRDLPDGGSFLLPLAYRPRASRENDRWLVVEVVPRIYIEEEERQIRGQVPK